MVITKITCIKLFCPTLIYVTYTNLRACLKVLFSYLLICNDLDMELPCFCIGSIFTGGYLLCGVMYLVPMHNHESNYLLDYVKTTS